mgnify:CR=1 FL=1
MNQFPKLSIVTVSYNCVNEIENTILSVINQDYPNLEYIIIDGGSTDGTLDIIKKYQHRISYFVSEPDRGLYDAMNKGIEKASGEWVTMRNCGDYFAEKDSLSKLFSEQVPDDVDFVCAAAYRVTDLGYYIATFVRTTWHKQHLFDTQYRVSADFNLLYNSAKAGRKFVFRNIPVVIFPTGGFSSIRWDVGKREGQKVLGNYDSTFQKIIVEFMIFKIRICFMFRKILKKIPAIKKKRDEILKRQYSIKPLPLPLTPFWLEK